MRHKQVATLYEGVNFLAGHLRATFGRRLQGPITPAVDRIRDEHIVEMSLKIEAKASFNRAREILAEKIELMRQRREFKYIITVCDVDPQ